jgi:hypothetical protein
MASAKGRRRWAKSVFQGGSQTARSMEPGRIRSPEAAEVAMVDLEVGAEPHRPGLGDLLGPVFFVLHLS